jgi:NADH-quinone oxidoreductase subunit J
MVGGLGIPMEAVMFYVLATITLVSALLVVLMRRPLHNVLFMILTMIGLACLFILLHAEFIAMVQLIVYAGAVMVLFLFVIMLLNLDQVGTGGESARSMRWWGGALIAVGVLGIVWMALKAFVPAGVSQAGSVATRSNTEILGRELFSTYLLPFEIASVLLLAAIIGAVILVRKRS